MKIGRSLLVCFVLGVGASPSVGAELQPGARYGAGYQPLVRPPCRQSYDATQLQCAPQYQAPSDELPEYNVVHGPQPAVHAPYTYLFSWQNR